MKTKVLRISAFSCSVSVRSATSHKAQEDPEYQEGENPGRHHHQQLLAWQEVAVCAHTCSVSVRWFSMSLKNRASFMYTMFIVKIQTVFSTLPITGPYLTGKHYILKGCGRQLAEIGGDIADAATLQGGVSALLGRAFLSRAAHSGLK